MRRMWRCRGFTGTLSIWFGCSSSRWCICCRPRSRKFQDRARTNTMHDAATHAVTHDDSKGQYFWVWGALLVLTAIEVVLGYKQVFQPVAMLEVLLGLSVVKSALIIAY